MSSDVVSLYLVRHGQTEGNVRNLFIGSTDIPLDETGVRQAHLLAERFREIPIDAIISSPLRRATQTADAIAAIDGMVVELRPDLAEIDFGEAEGHTIEAVRDRFSELFRLHVQPDSGGVQWPGGESRRDFSERVVASFQDICRVYSRESVAVVCHGGVIGALLSHIDGGLLNDWKKYSVHNCSITHIIANNERLTIVSMDDYAHLVDVQRDLFALE